MMGFFSGMNMSDPAASVAEAIPPELEIFVPPKTVKGRKRSNSTSKMSRGHSSTSNLTRPHTKSIDASNGSSSSLHSHNPMDMSDEAKAQRRRSSRRRSSTASRRPGSMRRGSSASNLFASVNDSLNGSFGMQEHLSEIEKFANLLKDSDHKLRNRILRDSLKSKQDQQEAEFHL